jgi:hypothetical protein
MKRHGIGQGAIAVKDVSGVLFFGRSKYGHSENRGIVARVQTDHNWFREKGAVQNFY